ncbi:uncharacterized protein LOC122055056 [Zingiber officinale]|uniref:uncharacterized protein LOC122055056 n=1 Tax=Zingiber officinale TaxID=94328 RepID=UPI001C4B6B8A|nr:uncharacterized protein LOC122055056 [Zingiber officinale]
MVKKFIGQHLICRFDNPRRLISDNGRQFVGRQLREWCEGYDIQQTFTSVAYPQRNGWVGALPGLLWAIRTTPKEGTDVTPFHLVYGGEAIVLVKVGIESDRVQQYDVDNAERRQLELDLVDETSTKADAQLTAYWQRMRQRYNRRVIPRSFQVDDLVWRKVKPVGDLGKLEAP